jgi:drug/metabolite transporter (DMT)-like permease
VLPRAATSTFSIRPRENIVRGILYYCASVVVAAIMSVGIKWLSDLYPAVELTFFRSLFGMIPALVFVRRAGGVATLRTQRPVGHFLRSGAWVLSFICSFLSLHFLTLATSIAFSFLAPLFMTILSVPMLGERVGIHRWTAVLVGFVGVLFMARPSGDVFQIGALFGLSNAFFWAIGSLSVRQLTRTETSSSITFYTHFFSTLILGAALPFFWTVPSWQGLLAMGALGLLGGFSQFWATQALSYAPAAAVAPFNYTQMIWAIIFGFIVWGDLPTLNLMIGVAIVVTSGLYILHRETRLKRIGAPPLPAPQGCDASP